MVSVKFFIKLYSVHQRSGKSMYRVAKDTGIHYNTVQKYLSGLTEADVLTPEVVQMAQYYGVDWRDPNIVEIIDEAAGDTKPVEPVDPKADPLAEEFVA